MAEPDREPPAAASSAEGLLYAGIGATVSFVLVLVLGLSIAAAGLSHADPGAGAASGPLDGASVFDKHCATCHGDNGEGGVGPTLIGVTEKYAAIETQILIVEQGRGAMPSFRSTLSEDEIRAVVIFEREAFLEAG